LPKKSDYNLINVDRSILGDRQDQPKPVGMLFVLPVAKHFEMKTRDKIIAGIGFATMVGLVIYLVRRRKTSKHVREQIAEHGYETAHDILFPLKSKRGRKFYHGPVLD
jgi:hypothetical protein